ncbi:MAG TPA: NfeD family protein [Gemmatimonadales bacterium]|nr:NfeD family protein [Gemmatimonadales bacterium]
MIDPQSGSVILQVLTNPVVAAALLSVGIIGLIAEVKAGLHGLGLLFGTLALGLFFGASIMVGLAGWGTMLMLGLGIVALGFEVFVLPGHGFTGILGAALVVAAMFAALLGPTPTSGDILQAAATIATSFLVIGIVAYSWIRHLPTSGRFAGLLHSSSVESAAGYIAAPARHDLIGAEGVAMTDLRPSGTADIAGEKVDVVTDGGYLPAGTRVQVIRTESYRQVVRAVS